MTRTKDDDDVVSKVNQLAGRLEGFPNNRKTFALHGECGNLHALIKAGNKLVFLRVSGVIRSIDGCGGLGYTTDARKFVELCVDIGLLTEDEGSRWSDLQTAAIRAKDEERRLADVQKEAEMLGYKLVKAPKTKAPKRGKS